ncbi:short-chain fatty acid transporter [Paraburkholderia dilworthii]|uniref:short-chain fatty acid transporter n=1 Tax=Paraburkholderia dilworthii TaxID=948106 RepID=UPI000427958F|nr:TIGR00366 family protein [Paraburkholderia dilworthii]
MKNTTTLDPAIPPSESGFLESIAIGVARWSERWFPDAYVFAAIAVAAVALGALAIGAPATRVAQTFGDGFWSLIPFTMQMAMIAITGYVVAVSTPASKLIAMLARVPRSGRAAITFVALISIGLSMFNWAISLVFSGLLVRALARRDDLRMDYRAAGAAAYLGMGATWALGLSSAAAQLQANPASLPKAISDITGVLPFSQTIFLPQSLIMAAALAVVSLAIAWCSAPRDARVVTAADLEVDLSEASMPASRAQRPGDWLEHSPLLTIVLVALGAGWLVHEFTTRDPLLAISNLNTYNFLFLMLGMLLHWRPYRFLQAVKTSVPSVAGVLIQFPLYGGIAFMLTKAAAPGGEALSHVLAAFFVSVSSHVSFPAVMGAYSAILGFFVPSGGGKWIIEAPYVMQAANDLRVHLGWAVQVYNAAEALPNLINPFWMLPLLGVLGLRARDIVGFTFTQLIVHVPLVLILLTVLARTLEFVPASMH